MTGLKHDDGKQFAAIPYQEFPRALREVVKVATFGARKYVRGNWVHVENAQERYLDALHRHLLAHHGGELLDAESGLTHLAHAAWNVLALLEMQQGKGAPEQVHTMVQPTPRTAGAMWHASSNAGEPELYANEPAGKWPDNCYVAYDSMLYRIHEGVVVRIASRGIADAAYVSRTANSLRVTLCLNDNLPIYNGYNGALIT